MTGHRTSDVRMAAATLTPGMLRALRTYDTRALDRLYGKVYRHARSLFRGGLRYGLDHPTLAACYPQHALVLLTIARELAARREADGCTTEEN